ncbi:ubiquitin domain-containing protein [Xylariomycetidae sp. FL0641]|nr:ubiquitin domain-containing protein [Xylariomycetidae sp. FL0641]
MGCCFSRPEAPNTPYADGDGASPSARAINPPSARPSATEESSHVRIPTRRQRQPLSQHIDKPLRRHEWVAKDRPWTRSDLDTQRTEFFETRVTGHEEVWSALKLALEQLWQADLLRAAGSHTGGNHDADALATAQTILKAAEITLPTGDPSDGAYDAQGNYYALPDWVVNDPANVAEDSRAHTSNSDTHHDRKGDDDLAIEEDSAGELDEDEALRRREEKGKAVVDVKNLIKVRARLSENHPDVTVSVDADESVRSMAAKIAEESGLPSTKRIRVAYMGKILKESSSLQSQGWKKGHIVNALVFEKDK